GKAYPRHPVPPRKHRDRIRPSPFAELSGACPEMSGLRKFIDPDQSLSRDDMAEAMRLIMDGDVSATDISAFLTALTKRGETVNEIAGAATILREKALTIKAPEGAIDCCGTGGDGQNTYNISTAVALVAA